MNLPKDKQFSKNLPKDTSYFTQKHAQRHQQSSKNFPKTQALFRQKLAK